MRQYVKDCDISGEKEAPRGLGKKLLSCQQLWSCVLRRALGLLQKKEEPRAWCFVIALT